MTDVQTYRDPAAPGPIPTPGGPLSYIHWGPGIAGAIVAAATSFVLMGFASAVGLMVASPSPTWRDTSVWLRFCPDSGSSWSRSAASRSAAIRPGACVELGGFDREVEFRDGVHGLIVWALGVMLGAVLLAMTASTFAAGTAASPARDTAGAPGFLAYEIDRLFRSERRPEPATPEVRAEAGRLIMKGLGRAELPSEDRMQLVRLTAAVSGLAPPEADRRVTQVVTDARSAASRARSSAVVLGFCLAAALAAAAAAAWIAAGIGGKHRDSEFAPPMRFGRVAVGRV